MKEKIANQNKKYLKIAVTGGIGSGKSTVCKLIRELGYSVFSCDEIYSEMLEDGSFSAAMEILFPGCTQGGCVNKKNLLNAVLTDKRLLDKLNAFSHPEIMRRLFEKMDAVARIAGHRFEETSIDGRETLCDSVVNAGLSTKNEGIFLVFAEVPLLFEGHFDGLFDKIIVVRRDETDKIRSVIKRDGCEEETVKRKMALQFNYSLPVEKENYPSFEKILFLDNSGSMITLKSKLEKLIKEILP